MSAAARAWARRRVGLLMFDDMELLDFAGPYEVFTTAQRMAERADAAGALPACGFEVLSMSRDGGPVRARAGLAVHADARLADAHPLDLLIVPGGEVRAALRDDALLTALAAQAREVPLLASVCTGAFLLGRAGLLRDGARVTTHWEDLDDLRAAEPALEVVGNVRWVCDEDGVHGRPVYTSAGISAGIDLSLHLVERLAGRALAERTARQMDVRWTEA